MRVNDCPLVLVSWVDAQSKDEWTDWDSITEDKEPLRVYTAGWLRYINQHNICIVSNAVPPDSGSPQGSMTMTIPRRAVDEIIYLHVDNKKPPEEKS